MANRKLFRSAPGGLLPGTDTRNAHGAPAYRLTPEQALAQYAATGCLNDTFYDSVLTNAARLARLPAGGTNCSAPLRHLNARRATGDLVIYVSAPWHGFESRRRKP